MPKKIIIDRDGVRKEFVAPDFGHRMHMMRHHHEMENDVKLFTDKSKMVDYVNQLTGIGNVEVFKIEDNLYKVLVTRRKKRDEKCCHEEEKQHKCCHEDEHEGNENQ